MKIFGGGNVTVAAKALGVSRQTIYNWLKVGSIPDKMRELLEFRAKAK